MLNIMYNWLLKREKPGPWKKKRGKIIVIVIRGGTNITRIEYLNNLQRRSFQHVQKQSRRIHA